MVITLGEGAFKIWIGTDKKRNRINSIGININDKRWPESVNLEATVNELVNNIEELINHNCPWCK